MPQLFPGYKPVILHMTELILLDQSRQLLLYCVKILWIRQGYTTRIPGLGSPGLNYYVAILCNPIPIYYKVIKFAWRHP